MSGLLLYLATRPKIVATGAGLILLATVAVQSARLSHAKADLHAAQDALRDPATGQSWRSEALAAKQSLASCADQREQVEGALATHNAAVERQRAAAQRTEQRLLQALQAARGVGRTERDNAARVLAGSAGADACRSADALILGSLVSKEANP